MNRLSLVSLSSLRLIQRSKDLLLARCRISQFALILRRTDLTNNLLEIDRECREVCILNYLVIHAQTGEFRVTDGSLSDSQFLCLCCLHVARIFKKVARRLVCDLMLAKHYGLYLPAVWQRRQGLELYQVALIALSALESRAAQASMLCILT